MIDYLRSVPAQQPMFAYVAYTAPHWPLQAPNDVLQKYRGRYDEGWDVVRARRLAKQQSLGMISNVSRAALRPAAVPAWETLAPEQQKRSARLMEIYAAMVDNLDQNVGRLLDVLRETGRDRNTVIVFLSDNGAESMVAEESKLPGLKEWIAQNFDNRLENLGHAGSYVSYGPSWAWVSSTPQRGFKGGAYEGGNKVPAFIVVPGGQPDSIDTYAAVLDLAPTFLALAGAAPTGSRNAGHDVLPLEGRALLDTRGRPVRGERARVANGELFGHRAVRQGALKAVSRWTGKGGSAPWELYDLGQDPGEEHDLAKWRSRDLARLEAQHDAWERNYGVILPAPDAPVLGSE
jgi:arylsulfatase